MMYLLFNNLSLYMLISKLVRVQNIIFIQVNFFPLNLTKNFEAFMLIKIDETRLTYLNLICLL